MNEHSKNDSSQEQEASAPPITSTQAMLQIRTDRPLSFLNGKAMGLMPGFEWNPLLNLPRNRPCPCLSGKKFKACCLNKLPRAVPESLAKQYVEQMGKPDLIFLTKENEHKVKKAVDDPEALRCKGCGHIATGLHDCPGPISEGGENGNDKA